MPRPPRIRWVGKTSAEWAAEPTYVLRRHEAGLNLSNGEQRLGDGVSPWSELSPVNPSTSSLAAVEASLTALETRVDLIEGAEPPPPVGTVLRYAAVSYHFPGNANWTTLQQNAAAGKLALVLANPDSGPGYEAKHEPGGSRHTSWTSSLTPIVTAGVPAYFYISTNYGDLSSASGSHAGAGSVGANWRITVNVDDTIQFWEKGTTSSAGGALGAARQMTFAAGAGPFGFKSWFSGTAAGVALPGGLALSTSYYLRPVGTTPTQTYTLHTSSAGAIANTGKVNITSTGGNALGPYFLGWRRNLANIATVTAEMTRCVTLFPDLCKGWFFDECQVDEVTHDAYFDAIKAYRDANHPTLKLVMNGTPHNATRANLYDIFVMENNWSAFLAGTEAIPSYLTDLTVPKEKAWAIIHDDVDVGELATAVTFCVNNKIGLVYLNGPSAFGALPTVANDGYTQDDVLAAIDVANV